MLLSLQISLQNELRSSVSHLTNIIEGIEDCTDPIESQLGTVIKAHDEMVDSNKEQADTVRQLQLRLRT